MVRFCFLIQSAPKYFETILEHFFVLCYSTFLFIFWQSCFRYLSSVCVLVASSSDVLLILM